MRTVEQAAADLRAEFGKEIFLVALDLKPDPDDGNKTQVKYQWWRTCSVDFVRLVLESIATELK